MNEINFQRFTILEEKYGQLEAVCQEYLNYKKLLFEMNDLSNKLYNLKYLELPDKNIFATNNPDNCFLFYKKDDLSDHFLLFEVNDNQGISLFIKNILSFEIASLFNPNEDIKKNIFDFFNNNLIIKKYKSFISYSYINLNYSTKVYEYIANKNIILIGLDEIIKHRVPKATDTEYTSIHHTGTLQDKGFVFIFKEAQLNDNFLKTDYIKKLMKTILSLNNEKMKLLVNEVKNSNNNSCFVFAVEFNF